MRFLSFTRSLGLAAGLLVATASGASAQTSIDSVAIRKIYDEALARGQSYDNLRYLTGQIGGRLSGSPQAEQAVQWGKTVMEKMGLDRVYLQEVMVPHWVRGAKEKAQVKGSKGKGLALNVCALGGSVGTNGKLKAQVIEVQSLKELAALPAEKVKGKFVFFNRPMNPLYVETGRAYGEAGDQRRSGAAEAAKRGAVGALVRSLSLAHDDFPHTGTMRYEDNVAKVPAAALSTNGADELSQLLKADPNLTVELEMSCQQLPETKSYNVVGEIKGSKYPEEIISVGGHLDSWDLGQGAHDDGTGCTQSMEVLRLLKATGLRPERTVRAVLFMNEENGVRGGTKYAEQAKALGEKHLAAMESDGGGFTPRGFSIEAEPATVRKIQAWQPLFRPYGSGEFTAGHSGTDIEPLKEQVKALIGYHCDSQRYFDIHHTAADTFDKVNRRELELGGASMAALIYLMSKYGL
ncbi:M20/M25/M40 family metallo-hydrolase [Hymenobacter pini]|uniref:M20/M25/M40 family metallo-hydrolase n=1 Tax=Hymenobacter pini TaxID=2880879 RepID=UPI001CF21A39|nr:M20/M25/M40 family metallo-hydrolase [Hymenobacter pini]MCA8830044.1 M20/M25/M40 family metallo-hydrolase [Hymenobacter pini]